MDIIKSGKVIKEIIKKEGRVYYDDHRLLYTKNPINIDAVKHLNEYNIDGEWGRDIVYYREGDNGYWSWK